MAAPAAGLRRARPQAKNEVRDVMDLLKLKIKSKASARKAAGRVVPVARVEGWRCIAAPWF